MKYLLIALVLFAQSALAELTDAQKAIVHADMISQPSLATAIATGDDIAIAAFYNTLASPNFWVWRTAVSKDEFQSAVSADATSFAWSGTGGYIARSQGERDAWRTMFNADGFVNPSLANVRAGFNDIFSGTGAQAVNNRAHLLSLSKRKASRAEKLLATGTGSNADPAVLSLDGPIDYVDASQARVWQ